MFILHDYSVMLQLNMSISMSGAGSSFKRDSFPTKGLILKSAVMREQSYLILVGLSRCLVILVGTMKDQVLFWLLFKSQHLSTVITAVLGTCNSFFLTIRIPYITHDDG